MEHPPVLGRTSSTVMMTVVKPAKKTRTPLRTRLRSLATSAGSGSKKHKAKRKQKRSAGPAKAQLVPVREGGTISAPATPVEDVPYFARTASSSAGASRSHVLRRTEGEEWGEEWGEGEKWEEEEEWWEKRKRGEDGEGGKEREEPTHNRHQRGSSMGSSRETAATIVAPTPDAIDEVVYTTWWYDCVRRNQLDSRLTSNSAVLVRVCDEIAGKAPRQRASNSWMLYQIAYEYCKTHHHFATIYYLCHNVQRRAKFNGLQLYVQNVLGQHTPRAPVTSANVLLAIHMYYARLMRQEAHKLLGQQISDMENLRVPIVDREHTREKEKSRRVAYHFEDQWDTDARSLDRQHRARSGHAPSAPFTLCLTGNRLYYSESDVRRSLSKPPPADLTSSHRSRFKGRLRTMRRKRSISAGEMKHAFAPLARKQSAPPMRSAADGTGVASDREIESAVAALSSGTGPPATAPSPVDKTRDAPVTMPDGQTPVVHEVVHVLHALQSGVNDGFTVQRKALELRRLHMDTPPEGRLGSIALDVYAEYLRVHYRAKYTPDPWRLYVNIFFEFLVQIDNPKVRTVCSSRLGPIVAHMIENVALVQRDIAANMQALTVTLEADATYYAQCRDYVQVAVTLSHLHSFLDLERVQLSREKAVVLVVASPRHTDKHTATLADLGVVMDELLRVLTNVQGEMNRLRSEGGGEVEGGGGEGGEVEGGGAEERGEGWENSASTSEVEVTGTPSTLTLSRSDTTSETLSTTSASPLPVTASQLEDLDMVVSLESDDGTVTNISTRAVGEAEGVEEVGEAAEDGEGEEDAVEAHNADRGKSRLSIYLRGTHSMPELPSLANPLATKFTIHQRRNSSAYEHRKVLYTKHRQSLHNLQ